MANKSVPASVEEVAFDCPHCGAFASQTWYELHASTRRSNSRTPGFPDEETRERIKQNHEMKEEMRDRLFDYIDKSQSGRAFLDKLNDSKYVGLDVGNLNVSQCFACGELSIWVHNRLVFPPARIGPEPNSDLPVDILRDYEEAREIHSVSPRGAAALLRLAIQKLCAHLGERGKNIDDDIASLMRKGLSPLVQKSLDAVRVIGNEAVHPGTLDLRDDTSTANSLFKLVNLIVEQMITNPKHVEELYSSLPEGKRHAIEKRDAKKEP
jgi:hypothetical protein